MPRKDKKLKKGGKVPQPDVSSDDELVNVSIPRGARKKAKPKTAASLSGVSTRKSEQTPPARVPAETQQPATVTPDVASVEVSDAPIPDLSEAGSSVQEEDEPEASQPVGGKRRGKRRSVFLTDEHKEEVMEFLIRNEGLYNRKKELWQQPHKKNELWQQQGRTMGVDWKDIHTWYETQRRRLGRLKSLANKSGSGSLEDTWKETDLEFWQQWKFLRPHISTQSREPVVSLRRRLASAPAPTLDLEAGPAQDAPEVAADAEDRPATCRRRITPATVGHATPVSTATQPGTRSSQTHAVDHIMEALVASSERHHQLINLSESLLRSQQVPAGQSRNRQQFNLWCGSLLQELPQDLYEQCEADMFRLMTHYRNLARQRPGDQAAAAPPQQPQSSNWTPNPPAASSVWASQGCDYVIQYNLQQPPSSPLSSCKLETAA